MKKYLFTSAFSLFLNILWGLNAGSIMFVGFNSDGTDGVAFVALEDIPANTIIYFSDNEYNNGFNTNESYWQWTSNSLVGASTIVIIQDINQGSLNGSSPNPTSNIGTVTWCTTTAPDSNSGLANSDEYVYAYLGTNYFTPTTFLSAIGSGSFGANLNDTGLSVGLTAVEFTGNQDVLIFLPAGNSSGGIYACTPISTCQTNISTTSNWLTDDGSGDQSNDGMGADFPASLLFALPVELVEFQVQKKTNGNHLSFTTASESNNSHFDIERSADGIGFKKIGEVAGAGYSLEAQHYSFTDKNPLPGINYYRLRQVDFDGSFAYSRIESVVFGKSGTIRLSPQPVNDVLRVQFEEPLRSDAAWQIVDFSGRLALVGTDQAESQQLDIDMTTLPQGTYVLRVADGAQSIVKQFQKQ